MTATTQPSSASADDPADAQHSVAQVSAESAVPTPSPTRAAGALLLAMLLLMIGNGLQGTLVGVRAELESFDTAWNGVTMAAYYAGFLIGARLTFNLLASVGHIRVFAALASTASTAALVHGVFVLPPVWIAARFLTGMCMAGLYVVAESWLNDVATTETRGRILAAYSLVSMGGVSAGQFMLGFGDPTTITLFVVTSVLVSISLVPVSLSTTSAPPVERPEPLPFRQLFRDVPSGVISMFVVGMGVGMLMGLGPLFATRSGLTNSQISLFLTAPVVGSLFFQFPLGIASDRIPRRGLMASMFIVASVAAFALGRTNPTSWTANALMLLLGGMAFPLYSLTIAFTNDWVTRNQMIATSTLLIRINGAGALCGPLVGTAAFVTIGIGSYFPLIGLSYAVGAIYLLWRILVKDAVPVERQRSWVPLPSRGTPVIAALSRHRRHRR